MSVSKQALAAPFISGRIPVASDRASLCLMLVVMCVFSLPALCADDAPLPDRIVQGFAAYDGSDGARKAVEQWISGGPLGRIVKPDKLVQKLHKIEYICGEYQDYEVFSISPIASRTQVAYLVVNYRLCPVFARYVLYQSDDETVITEFNMRTKPEEIFPAFMLNPGTQ